MVVSTTKNLEPLDLSKVDFFELLAHTADSMKQSLVMQLIPLVGKGDPAALRLLEKALLQSSTVDNKNKPIPILGGLTQNKDVVQSNDSPPQNPKAK